MEWWEYLIVLVVWFVSWGAIAQATGFEASREWTGGASDRQILQFILGLLTFCSLLLLLITYKLFIDPIW